MTKFLESILQTVGLEVLLETFKGKIIYLVKNIGVVLFMSSELLKNRAMLGHYYNYLFFQF